jgi:hypothetical protein
LFCGRPSPENFILPSLVLLCSEPLQFELVLFPCHDGSSSCGAGIKDNVNG